MRRLVLLGGGHAHLEVLRQASRKRFDGGEILVISPSAHAHYTGMIPGFISGRYPEEALTFDIAALTRAAGGVFRQGRAATVAADGCSVTLDDGEVIACDLVSADVGSVPAGLHTIPGAESYTHGARPIVRARALCAAVDAALSRPMRAERVCVVGGGAGGIEIAFALRARAERAGAPLPIALIDSNPVLLAGFSAGVRRRAAETLAARGIGTCTGAGAEVIAVEPTQLTLASGGTVTSTVTVWLTGAAPAGVTAASVFPKDESGFWLVDRTLRSVGGAPVWGAGDCVSLRDHPWVPKAGVYAVREAPVLAANLRAALSTGPGPARHVYRPQRGYLAILDTADGRALLRWKKLALEGRPPLWLKRHIDRRFVRRYAT